MIRLLPIFIVIVLSTVALLFPSPLNAQERHLRTYTLQHALAEQIVSVIAPQLSSGSNVTAYRQELILNVTDAEYRNIQALLTQLDTTPRSLMISVRKTGQQLDNEERYGVQGRIGDGNVQVQSGNGWQKRTETQVIVNRGSTQSSRDGSQQVRAVEGMEAFINTGNVVSMRSGYRGERELVPVDSGFYATARIVGDEVIVDIDQRDDRVQGRGIATQQLQTQIRGRIGEWIPLGGLNASQSSNERAVTNYGNNSSNSISDLAIKVESLDR